MDLVSVIIPAYHAEAYIGEALESVAAQTHPDWEVIVVEDASHGGTEEIVAKFRESVRDHRVEFIRHDRNQGVSATRNTAIQAALGQWLALLDYDDVWRPDHLARSIEALVQNGADISFSAVSAIDEGSGEIKDLAFSFPQESQFGKALVERNFIVNSSVVMRRQALDQVGLFDSDPVLQFAEDYDLWLRFVDCGMAFTAIQERTTLYRSHPQQATGINIDLDKAYDRGCALWRRHSHVRGVSHSVTRNRGADANIAAAMHYWSKAPSRSFAYLLQALRFCPFRLDGWRLLVRQAWNLAFAPRNMQKTS